MWALSNHKEAWDLCQAEERQRKSKAYDYLEVDYITYSNWLLANYTTSWQTVVGTKTKEIHRQES